MQDFSTTQASNIASFVGILMLILNHFKINISTDEVTQVTGALITLGGIAWNFYHRYSKGDLTVLGARKA